MTVLDTVTTGRTLTSAEFDELALPVGSSGLPLGHGVWGAGAGRDVVLDVFRSQRTQVASFLGVEMAAVIARRMQRCGAAVVIASVEPGWEALLRLSRHDPVPVRAPSETEQRLTGSFARPLVEVAAAQPLVGAREDGPREWCTSMTMLPNVDLRSTTHARTADVTLLGRTSPESASVIGAVLSMVWREISALEKLPWDHIMVISDHRCTVVNLGLTKEELRLRAAVSGWQGARPRRSGAAVAGRD